ncbi:hypothetical protein C9J60_24725 [Streptomyces sp. A244]|nr:hypothetical protein C9J60_24725 [Streptomyces sp. A244]
MAAAYDVVLLTGTEPSWEKPFAVDHAVVDLNAPLSYLPVAVLSTRPGPGHVLQRASGSSPTDEYRPRPGRVPRGRSGRCS